MHLLISFVKHHLNNDKGIRKAKYTEKRMGEVMKDDDKMFEVGRQTQYLLETKSAFVKGQTSGEPKYKTIHALEPEKHRT